MAAKQPKEYALCPKCKKFDDTSTWSFHKEYCLECGTKLVRECPGCKKAIYADGNCCTQCGHRLI